jgi:D-alanine-D-alanine ligase
LPSILGTGKKFENKFNIMPGKLKVAVIFGGRSGEHEVSLLSAESVIKNLDKNKYKIFPIGIAKNGQWITGENSLRLLKSAGSVKNLKVSDADQKKIIVINDGSIGMRDKIDVFFPVLHGTCGEDGAIQGLLEMVGLPYVGCGILSSAAAMDKIIQKIICKAQGIKVADWVELTKKEWHKLEKNKILFKKWIEGVEKRLGYPMFVKPSNLGSSIGITKARNRAEMIEAINEAALFDRRILIEQGIKDALEIEVAVLGNDEPRVSVPGQVISSNEFYDYDAKYVNGKSELIIPASLPAAVAAQARAMAVEAFKLLDGAGMARVDFLIQPKNNWKIYLSELNTIPGFTAVSMYSKLWEASGLSYKKLLDKLIELAYERYNDKKQLKTNY